MKNNSSQKLTQMKSLIFFILAAPLPSYSINQLTVRITVTEAPPCVINNNNIIEVDFGDVLTTRINGDNYKKQIYYDLQCGSLLKNALRFKLIGGDIDLGRGTSSLITSIPNLGIEIKNNNAAFNINNWINFTYPAKPVLWAVPVMKQGVSLTEGVFTATSLMMVEYQ